MKYSISILALVACLGAHAHGTPPPKSPPATAAPTQNLQVGITTIAGAFAAGGQGGGGGAGGLGGNGYGGAGGSVGSVFAGGVDLAGARIGSDVAVERSAPAIFGATPTQPTQPCARPGISIGGSSTGGGGLINVPTGTDVTCRVDNALVIMNKNPKLFSDADRLKVSCKQEDIAETPTCKDLAKREADAARAIAILEDRRPAVTASAASDLLP